jgi:hypothetical protein
MTTVVSLLGLFLGITFGLTLLAGLSDAVERRRP